MRFVKGSLLTIGTVVLLASCVSPAFAETAWWHVTSGTRPGNLHFGTARDAIQKITVKATGGTFVLARMTKEEVEKREYFEEEVIPKFSEFPYDASASQVQVGLEELYGAGNVAVSGGPGDATGSHPYVVEFKGEAGDQPVPLLNTEIPGEPVPLEGTVEAEQVARGNADGEIYVTAENVGNAPADGAKAPIRIADVLPPGVHAVAIAGMRPDDQNFVEAFPLSCSATTVSCTVSASIPAFDQVEMRITVAVEHGGPLSAPNKVTVSGGEAPEASIERQLQLSNASTPFGVENYELTPEEEGGVPATQAGVHPFQLTTTIDLNQGDDEDLPGPIKSRFEPVVQPVQLAKDVNFKWPPGLVGNPTPLPQCPTRLFLSALNFEGFCPEDTVVGVAVVTINEPFSFGMLTFTVPLVNLAPRVGEPARFGFFVPAADVPVYIDTSVRTGGDYGITVSVNNISQTASLISSEVTVFGVPGDLRHAGQRGWGCLRSSREVESFEPCELPNEISQAARPVPFLQMPTSCTGPLVTSIESDSWTQPEPPGEQEPFPAAAMPALDGCNRAPFHPALIVTPDGTAGSTPTGLNVDVHNPQENTLNPAGLAEPDVKDITVTLPQGVSINPAGADGLGACSEEQVGYLPRSSGEAIGALQFTSTLPKQPCPDASKIGTVTIKTPLLPNPLRGTVYLAEQNANPFGSLVAMYVIAEDPVSGVLVKLAGEVRLDPTTGQIVTTFANNPQLPFEDAELHFFGGERAPLATPARCGTYTSTASFAPWTGTEPAQLSSNIEVSSGPNGSPCPGTSLPFAPSLTAGTTSIQAGGFSPFTMTMSREDGQQNLQAIRLRMPPGMSGTLSTVKLCGEEQANAGTCGPESQIGETIVSVGLGGQPFTVTGGKVYITSPYKGAPFGLSIVNPAKAGPFDLGKVIVRAKIDVDPETAVLTITTDDEGPYKIPTIIDGIPLQIKHINVDINRPGFTFNPTNCSHLSITGTLDSTEGASQALSVPFQATNCAVLAFKPKLTASTSGRTSRAKGASLTVKLGYPAGPYDANIAKVKVELPKALPSRLTTLQKACTAAVFEANPADCPAASVIGHATATTPVLPVPLTGPAIFVSHGNESFPSLVVVLQGYGVTVHLVGSTFISKTGITSSTFKTVPDVPVGTFELTLPEGSYSALAANGNLCKAKLAMPTEFLGQNGALIKTTTKIQATGCSKAKKKSAHRKTSKKQAKHKAKSGGKGTNGKRGKA